MYIEVSRSGGVAGMIRRARVDTDSLAEQSAGEWHRLAESALPLLTSHANTPPPRRQRDGFVWTVSIDDAMCEIGESAMSGPLLAFAERALREGSRP